MSALLTTATIIAPFAAAYADDECKGENGRDIVVVDYVTGGATYDVKIDSCKTQELIDSYGDAKDAASLGSIIGSGFWPAAVGSASAFAWAWNNQGKLKDCASDGTGVKLKEINGIYTSCSAQ